MGNERAAAMFAGPYEGVDAKQQLTFQAKCAVQVFSSFYGQGDLGAQLKRLRSVYEVYEEMAPLKAKARADGTYCKNSENLFGYFEFAGIKINMHNLPDKPSEWDEYFYKMGWSVKPRNGNSEDGAPFTRGIKKISTYSYFLENMDSVMTLCNEYGSKRLFGMFPEMFYQTLKPKAELIDLTTPYNPDNPPGNWETFLDHNLSASKTRTIVLPAAMPGSLMQLLMSPIFKNTNMWRNTAQLGEKLRSGMFSLAKFPYVNGTFNEFIKRVSGEGEYFDYSEEKNGVTVGRLAAPYSDNQYLVDVFPNQKVPKGVLEINPVHEDFEKWSRIVRGKRATI